MHSQANGFQVVTGRRKAAPSAPNASVYFAAMWGNAQYRRALVNYMIKCFAVDDHSKTASTIVNLVRSSLKESDKAIMIKIVATLRVHTLYDGPSIKRAEERCRIVAQMLGNEFKITALLDIGCGDGSITACVGKHFNIPQAETYGVDILAACTQPITYSNTTKKLADNSVDLVMAFVSLHHINDIPETLTEIYRVLRPGGMVIIREHDFDGSNTMQAYLHLIHVFGDMKSGDDCDINAVVNGSHYKPRASWDALFESQFVICGHFSYGVSNPQALYHSMYRTRK